MTVSSTSALNSSPLLLAFDFDHTIVDGNTDTWITRAAPGGDIPQSAFTSPLVQANTFGYSTAGSTLAAESRYQPCNRSRKVS